jgi:hypothetical protein
MIIDITGPVIEHRRPSSARRRSSVWSKSECSAWPSRYHAILSNQDARWTAQETAWSSHDNPTTAADGDFER